MGPAPLVDADVTALALLIAAPLLRLCSDSGLVGPNPSAGSWMSHSDVRWRREQWLQTRLLAVLQCLAKWLCFPHLKQHLFACSRFRFSSGDTADVQWARTWS